MDIANIYDSKRDVQEFDKLEVKLISVIDTVEELIKQQKELNPLFAKGTPKEYASAMSQLDDVLKRLAKTERDLLELTKNYDKITQSANQTTKETAKTTARTTKEKAILREENRLINKELKDQAQIEIQALGRLNASLGLYNKVQLKLNALTVKYNELAIKKQLGIKLSATEEKSYNNLSAKIQKYDQVLKAVDASVGKYSRNVGNYASGFNPLSNSINQLTREAPAFANSLQTGFMAISNNLPIFFDAMGQAIAQQKELQAQGKPSKNALQLIAGSLFSFQTLLSVGVTLLTIYGPEMWKWTKAMISGKEAIDKTAEAQKSLNEAFKDSDYKKAVKDISELKNNVELAKQGFLSKEKVLQQYNETLGKVMGSAKSLDEIEQILTKNADNYIKATLYKAAANLALDKAAESMIKAEEVRQKKLEEFRNSAESTRLSGGTMGMGGGSFNAQEYERETQRIKKAQEKRKNDEIKANQDAAKVQEDIAKNFLKNAVQFGKGMNFDFTLGLKDPKQKAVRDNSFKDYLRDLEAMRDRLLAINERNYIEGAISEEQYVEKIFQINKAYYEKKLAFIKGKNATERRMIADTQLDLVKAEKERDRKIYDIQKKRLDDSKSLMEAEIANKMKAVQNDPYLMETERIKQQASVYDELIKRSDLYYESRKVAAKNDKEEILKIEKERDEKRIELLTKLQDLMAGMPDAVQKDFQYYQKIEDAYRTASDLEERRKILANSKLTINQRDYLISVLEKDQTIERLSLQEKQLQSEKEALETKEKSSQLTLLESQRLAEINLQLSDISYELERQSKQKLVLEWGELRKNLSPTIDYIRNSFNNLGLDNLANSFDSVLDEIGERFKETGKIAFTFKDAVILASSAAADALTQISNAQKERTIANLDEQLKASQESSEQEIGFINSRLEMLNAIQDKTVEQTQERNALEDEARVIKEQQLQREKLIAAQKARAEQRAAAQQALINGGLAATKTLATLGVPAGLLPAGIALAFGAVQAGLIMAKNPVPQYFIGTNHASEGWALTQERGAEIITDKSGNIKTWGNNRGSQMTYMEEGDRVLTAFESQDFKKKIRDVSMPDNIFLNNARESVLPTMIIQKDNIDYDKLADKVGGHFERVIKKYDKVNIYEENGVIYKQTGSNHPVVIGYSSKPKNDKPNNRDYRNFRD